MFNLAFAPYAEVAADFGDFKPRKKAGLIMRGGNVVERKVRRQAGPDLPLAEGYHVESSFTPRQRELVAISIATLNLTAQGRTLQKDVTPPPAFARRVITHFKDQPAGKARFGDAIQDAIFGVVDDFGQLYPNLTPAVRVLCEVGGIQGVSIAFNAARLAIVDIINPDAPLAGKHTFTKHGATALHFTSSHPNSTDDPKKYEVWCSGEAVGKTIIRQSCQAASILAAPDAYDLNGYNALGDNFFTDRYFGFDDHLQDRVDAAVAAAAEAHTRGELA